MSTQRRRPTGPTRTKGRKAPAARADVMSATCPSRRVLRHLGSRWGALVLLALEDGTQRFGALRTRVEGVSERMLSQTLQLLERDGFVDRVVHQEMPPRVEYTLTPLGEEAAARVRGLADWIEASLPRINEAWDERGGALDDEDA